MAPRRRSGRIGQPRGERKTSRPDDAIEEGSSIVAEDPSAPIQGSTTGSSSHEPNPDEHDPREQDPDEYHPYYESGNLQTFSQQPVAYSNDLRSDPSSLGVVVIQGPPDHPQPVCVKWSEVPDPTVYTSFRPIMALRGELSCYTCESWKQPVAVLGTDSPYVGSVEWYHALPESGMALERLLIFATVASAIMHRLGMQLIPVLRESLDEDNFGHYTGSIDASGNFAHKALSIGLRHRKPQPRPFSPLGGVFNTLLHELAHARLAFFLRAWAGDQELVHGELFEAVNREIIRTYEDLRRELGETYFRPYHLFVDVDIAQEDLTREVRVERDEREIGELDGLKAELRPLYGPIVDTLR